jgi:DNA processing protein
MHVVEPFWAAALRFGKGLSWSSLRDRVGPAGLDGVSDELLLAAGLPPDRLASFRAQGALRSLGRPLCLADAGYPPALLALERPPPVLLVDGDAGLLSARCVAVVGTRRMTAYGELVARRLGEGLAARGITVVSGLARGIDGAAHRGGIARTVAVLGHGLGTTAPPMHRPLRRSILEHGGAVVSAWPDDIAPAAWTFPMRNAVVAGLCEAIVVVEAPERSGALITARLGAELGRDVWAVPGPVGAESSVGCNRLIRDGAGIMLDVDGFLDGLGAARPARPPWQTLLFDGAEADAVARARGGSVSAMLAELAAMEVRGAVVRLPGGRYAPA